MGKARVYVDDIQRCCFRRDLSQDLSTMRTIITTLPGTNLVADDKTCSGLRIDWIGWSFDLDHYTVGIADKQLLQNSPWRSCGETGGEDSGPNASYPGFMGVAL